MATLTERSDDNNKETELAVLRPQNPEAQEDEDPEQPAESFWYLFCCGTTPSCCGSISQRFKSIFQRRPSSMHPLDGLRAVAVLLVIGCHAIGPIFE